VIYSLQSRGLPCLRVLVAEDDPTNIILVEAVLSLFGTEATIVENGKLAVEKVHESPVFDLVLMDLKMPVMNGFEALQGIRQRLEQPPLTRYLNVVALTAHEGEGIRQHCLDVGFDDFLSKPMRLEALDALLTRVAQMKKLGSYSSVKG